MVLSDELGANDSVYKTIKNPRQGGFKATRFVFVMMGLENIGFVTNMASLVLYFMYKMKFDLSGSATTYTNYLGMAFLFTLVGGFISDTYMNRLNTALVFGFIELVGYALLIIQSHYPSLQPEACGKSSCLQGTDALLFYASITLSALGIGGVRGAVPSLGADQYDHKDPKESKSIASFFNWFLFSITMGATIGVTFVVYASTNVGWDVGFIISLSCAFLGLAFLALGRPYYRHRAPGDSPLLRVLQVLVVTWKNRKLELPQDSDELYELGDHEAGLKVVETIPHTKQFRLLDKSAVAPEGATKPSKWTVCTVTQVEEVKILTRMMPILLSTILMNTCLAQLQTFSVQQGTLMNTRLGGFSVPPASIPVIPLVFMTALIPVYELALVPLLRGLTGRPSGISHLQRVGVGLVLSTLSMALAGAVEVFRKRQLALHGYKISLFWLSFHYAIFGIADMFTLVGLMEFFYSEAPVTMRSLSTSFSWLSLSIGYFLSSVFVEVIDSVTRRLGGSSGKGWLEGRDMNKNHVEYFYWFLAGLSFFNFGNYLFWAKWYVYKSDVPVERRSLLKVGRGNNEFFSESFSAVSNRVEDGEEVEPERIAL